MVGVTKETVSGPSSAKPQIAHLLSDWLRPALGTAICWGVLGTAVARADDGSSFGFRKPTLEVPELGQRVMVEVLRTGDLSASASVDVVTLPGTATPGEDYAPSQTTLHFEPGQTNNFAFVQVLADTAQEPQETFVAALTNASSGATIETPAQATITINDSAHISLSAIDEANMRAALVQGGAINLNTNFVLRVTNAFEVTKDTAIHATGALAEVDGAQFSRVFHVHQGVTLVLKGLTIRNGASDVGAGLYNDGGFVNLTDCKFLGNSSHGTNATGNVPSWGGAVYNAGQLLVTNCVFAVNTAQGYPGAEVGGYAAGQGGIASGGAVYNRGILWVENSAFEANVARGGNGVSRTGGTGTISIAGGYGGNVFGGAIYNTSIARFFGASFARNSAVGGAGGSATAEGWDPHARGGDGGSAEAGAVYNVGHLEMTGCFSESNAAIGNGPGNGYFSGPGGSARGGSILNEGLLRVYENCSFRNNRVRPSGGGGMKGHLHGAGWGGGICNNASAIIDGALFVGNEAFTFAGEAAGGAICNSGTSLAVSSSHFMSNSVTAGIKGDWYYGSSGFDAYGGAVMNTTTAIFTQCAFRANAVRGGAPLPNHANRPGGSGFGGGVANRGTLSIRACSFTLNRAIGADGGYNMDYYTGVGASRGGNAAGAGIWTDGGSLDLLNTTVAANQAYPGTGGSMPTNATGANSSRGGGGGSAIGAGLYSTNASVQVAHCTFAHHLASGGIAGLGSGYFAGQRGTPGTTRGTSICIETNSTLSLLNTIVGVKDFADIWGSFSGDHNLITKEYFQHGYMVTNVFGTEYYPLMQDSPAIDAARPLPEVQTDQSGISRPFGAVPDLGATEWNGTSFYPYMAVTSFERGAGHPVLKGFGPPGTVATLQVSSDLTNWTDSVTVEITTNGLFQVAPVPVPGQAQGFYRLFSVEK